MIRRGRCVSAVAAAFLLSAPEPGYAQVAANQLCNAAGFGSGCIGALRPSSIPRLGRGAAVPRGGAGGGMPGTGGMMGMFTSILTSIAIDAIANSLTEGAAAQPQAPGNLATRAQQLQNTVNAHQDFQNQQDQNLVNSLLDSSANRLIDSASDLRPLEAQADEAGCIFDGNRCGGENKLWLPNDVWFSAKPTPAGTQYAAPLEQPAAARWGPQQVTRVECTGQLCAFPQQAPAPTPVQLPASYTPPPNLGLGIAPILGSGAPAIPPPRMRLDDPAQQAEPECRERASFDLKSTFVTAFRSKPLRPVEAAGDAARETQRRLMEDPRVGVDLMVTYLIDKSKVLPELNSTVAHQGIEFYDRFMTRLMCQTFQTLSDALINPDRALERVDAMAENTLRAMDDSLIETLPYGKQIRLVMDGRYWDALKDVRDIAVENVSQQGRDMLGDAAKTRARDMIERKFHATGLQDDLRALNAGSHPWTRMPSWFFEKSI